MRRKSLKCAALAAVAGTMLQFGGCDLGGLLNQALIGAARQVGADQAGALSGITDIFTDLIPGGDGG